MLRFTAGACVALCGALALGAAAPSDPELIELRDAHVVVGNDPAPPPDGDPRWQAIGLPDYWWESRSRAGGCAWYRFDLPPIPWGEARSAVQILSVSLTTAAYVNGEAIGDGGRMETPLAYNWNRPLAWSFSSRALGTQRDVLHVRVCGEKDLWTWLGPVRFGPAARIERDNARRTVLQVRLAQISTGLGAALFLLVGVIWLATQRDPVYGWFLGVSSAWIIASLNYHLQDLPLPLLAWQKLAAIAVVLQAPPSAMLVHRLLGLEAPRVERGLALSTACVVLALALAPRSAFIDVASVSYVWGMLVGIYAGVLVARHARSFSSTELVIFSISTAVFLAIAGHDTGIQLGWVPFDHPRLLAYGAPLILTAFASVLIARFARTYARALDQNAALEHAVAEKRAELEATFARTAQLERERALAAERERLMREMHDGMGGQLVSALAMVRSGAATRDEVATALSDALQDMRLMLQSLDPGAQDLELLLALLRERIEPRLARAGLALRWSAGDLGAHMTLSPERALHVMRIVEEAVTNVLKHAKATEVSIASGSRAASDGRPGAFVRIADDGRGFGADAVAGRGLGNLRARAAELGGALEIASNERGTRVELWIPTRSA
jgi:signal transduction histidine kinase